MKRGGLEKVCRDMEKRCPLEILLTHTHKCAGSTPLEPVRRSTRGDRGCTPLYAWGPGLRSGSWLAFWALAGWQGGVAGRVGWQGGEGGVAVRVGVECGRPGGVWPGGGRCYCHSHAHSSNY